MSHCTACDKLLSDREARRRHEKTGEEIGLCDYCLGIVLEVQDIPLADPEDYESLEQARDSGCIPPEDTELFDLGDV